MTYQIENINTKFEKPDRKILDQEMPNRSISRMFKDQQNSGTPPGFDNRQSSRQGLATLASAIRNLPTFISWRLLTYRIGKLNPDEAFESRDTRLRTETILNKMEQRKINVALMSWLLSFVAGYADITTFICANRLFSAHVTGNFVVFVYSILTNPHSSVWLNLFSFPFFIGAVAVSSIIVSSSKYPGNVLRIEAIVLSIAGATAAILKLAGMENPFSIFLLAMAIVVAMGLQNGFGKLYPYTTYSATTIMTGNVTQITLDFMRRVTGRTGSIETSHNLRKQGFIIGSFFTGCLGGGILSHFIGLSAIVLPGLIMIYFWKERKRLILMDKDQ